MCRSEVLNHRDVGTDQGDERKRRWDGWAVKLNVHGIFKKKLKLKGQLIKDVSWLTRLFLTFSFSSLPDTDTASLLFGCTLINTLCLSSTCPLHPPISTADLPRSLNAVMKVLLL